ncbi:MAG: hypothetical protein IPI55_02190 [Flavobacteriales bacterium]|nr:hypothetical protein [Flavobacteriales bacterium]
MTMQPYKWISPSSHRPHYRGLKESGVLEDDASLGIVVTDPVLAYYRKRRS